MDVSAVNIMISKMIKKSIVIHLIPFIPKFKENDHHITFLSGKNSRTAIKI